jgi:hypothetical protein
MKAIAPQPRGRLVGRDRELDSLVAEFESTRTGRGAAVMIIGEPGIGKTALVASIAAHAQADGALVLWGRCSDLGGQAEWGPVAQALGALLDQGVLDATLAARCGGGLLSILPDLAHVGVELVPPVGADPETIAFGVARATTRLLRQICLQHRCVLVIDDAHDADPASLRLLARLAQEARTMSLLILATAREAELGARERVAEVAELTRDLAVLRIAALDPDASEAMVRRVAPVLSSALVARVLAVAGGNPLYLGELAALLAARSVGAQEELPIPVGIKASIRSRLDRLPEDARAFVEAIAVFGGQAPIERAAEVAGTSASAMIPAREAGIVVPAGSNVARLSHALVRDVAYAEQPHGVRAERHRRAATIAAALAADGDHDAAIEHVHHLSACGAAAEAIDAALVVARAAELRAADDEAVSILEVASAAAETGVVDDRRRVELAIALGRAQLRSGHAESGIATCVRAAGIAERLGDSDLVARAALARGSVFRFGYVDRGLVQALKDATARRTGREDALHARLLARLAAAEQPSLDPWQPIARAHEAFGLARRLGDDHVLLDVLHDGMAACVDIEDPHVRLGLNRELYDLARRHRAPWYELRALNRLIFDHAEVGDVDQADAVLEALDSVARSFAHPRHQWRVAMLRAMRAVQDGRWAAADRHADEAVALGGDDPLLLTAVFGHRYGRLRAQERTEESIRLLEDERELLLSIPEGEAILATFQAAAFARAGDLGKAARCLPVARRCLQLYDVALLTLFAEAAVAVGDRDACAFVEPFLTPRAHRIASGGPMFMYIVDPVERYLGLVVARLGDRPRAIVHLESALARLRAAGSLPFIARTALDLATLLESGTAADRSRAAALFAECAELAERFDLADLRGRDIGGSTHARNSATPFVPISPGFHLVSEGDSWAITSRGRTFRMRDSRGLRILARLIDNAGVDLHALDLADSSDGDAMIDRGDSGYILDARARAEYRARLVDLRDDLAEAERRGDLGWIDRLRTESETIQNELSRAFGRDGRARRGGVAAERARSAVTRRVREAIARIREHDRELGDHLAWAVRTGMTCAYRGKPT